MSGTHIADVTHFYNKISVAVLELTDTIRIGDTVHILGRSTDHRQEVSSLQIEHEPVDEAKPGQDVALEVDRRVRPGDKVYRITEEG